MLKKSWLILESGCPRVPFYDKGNLDNSSWGDMSSTTAMAGSGTDDLKSDLNYKTVYEEKSNRGLNDQSNNVMAE